MAVAQGGENHTNAVLLSLTGGDSFVPLITWHQLQLPARMKLPFLFCQRPLAPNAPQKASTYFWVSLIALLWLGSLVGCQRAPQAYVAPTHHPAYGQTQTGSSLVESSPDSVLTASGHESLPLASRPVWQQPARLTRQPTNTVSLSPAGSGQQPWRLHPARALPPACDQIVLRSGDVIEAKVKEVGVNEIRYKKCDRPDGPDYTISKRDVLSIKYPNGEVERFNSATANPSYGTSSGSNRPSYQSPASPPSDGPRTDPFAIVAIAAGGLAIFTGLGSLLLGAAAVVFGALSLSRIRKEPNRFKGKGLAMAGMIIGIVAAAAILLYVYVL